MYPPGKLFSLVGYMVAMADKVAEKLVNIVVDNVADNVADNAVENEEDNEMDTQSANAYTVKWPIIPPNCEQSVSRLNTKHSLGVETPPGKSKELEPTAVSHNTSSPSESTSNMPGIKATKSMMALPYYSRPHIGNHFDWRKMQHHSSQPLLQLHG
jgi:hypothetical protein